ncbi:uncharacterized protein LOC123518381 [Portunus trituberculatus]|nr:uncharacterized protein LOC123518381 [Portunus trituberculatus]XP_045135119.1 uncharacterized protein LOC123518381 [Portunus trituberculatus]XP_045135120.1 uncharacterized protein LOC123518381 [Portunus trituberculatus]XP_045135121.1 uncharacterized protein LOC123518381 [Portunus trituberculatus]
MRCGSAVVVTGLVMVLVAVVVSEAWEPVASLFEAGERLRTMQASVRWMRGGDAYLSAASTFRSPSRRMEVRAPGSLSSLKKQRNLHNVVWERAMGHTRQLFFGSLSLISLALLTFGGILFDVVGGALSKRSGEAKETVLPGLGLLGDALNNLTEVALNAITIYLYREESPDCSERLLCESSQQAGQRGLLDSLVNYLTGLFVSLFLPEHPLSRSLEAMRAGRRSDDCVGLYPHCSVKL